MDRFRVVATTLIGIVFIAGSWWMVDRIIQLGSERGLSDLACLDGQIVVFHAQAKLWRCGNPPGDTLADLFCSEGQLPRFRGDQWMCEDAPGGDFAGLTCSDEQIAVFDGASNDWVCGDMPSAALAGLSCSDGQIAVLDGASNDWICGELPSVTLAGLTCSEGQTLSHLSGQWACTAPSGDTLADLSCAEGNVGVFDTGANAWVCESRRFVLVAFDGSEAGPVVGYDGTGVIVAMTMNDAAGTPRTFLQPYGAGGTSSDGPGFGVTFGGDIYFVDPVDGDCSGTPYFLFPTVNERKLPPVYEATVTIRDDPGDFDVYLAHLETTVSPRPDINKKKRAYGGCDDLQAWEIASLSGTALYAGEKLADDLELLFPAPLRLEAR